MRPPEHDAAHDRWQAEADLLAQGRDWLERWSQAARYRHLYPEGPHLGGLLEAYQELERRRLVGQVPTKPSRRRRLFKRLLREVFARETLDRNRRLVYRYPEPRLRPLPEASPLLERALGSVDADARPFVEAHVLGTGAPWGAVGFPRDGMTARGLSQFKQALLNAALAEPDAIITLHPQVIRLLGSAQPKRRRHPIARYLLVKLPLQLVLSLLLLFNLAYVGAYFFFNDAVLGRFIGERVSTLFEGDLELGSVHWSPRLLLDLVTGTPSPVVVEDVTVWEPYKHLGTGRQGMAAHAERLEVTIVLHEIIPWTRLGIPTLFDIPWILHFPTVRTDEHAWFSVRSYAETLETGERVEYIGLRDAFRLYDQNRPPSPHPGLSFAVDDARLGPTDVLLSFPELPPPLVAQPRPEGETTTTDDDDAVLEETGWAVQTALQHAAFSLAFDAPLGATPPSVLPFSFDLSGEGRSGWVEIQGIHVPFTDLALEHFASGHYGHERGTIGFRGELVAAGSPLAVEGALRDALVRIVDRALPANQVPPFGELSTVVLEGVTADVGPVAEQITAELDLPPGTVSAPQAPATFEVEGPLTDPTYRIAAQGVSLDVLQEPAWVADDVALSVTLSRRSLPQERWRGRTGASPIDAPRMIAVFDTFQGSALDGTFKLPFLGEPAVVAFPEVPGDPWLIAADLEVASVNPAKLVPEDPKLQPVLAGGALGEVRVELVVPSGDEPTQAETAIDLVFHDLQIRRDRGPQADSLPKRVQLDGRVMLDEGHLEFDDLVVAVDGGRLRTDGSVNLERDVLSPTMLDFTVDDGDAFATAFAIPPWFERLRAQINLFGPVFAPSGRDGSVYVRAPGGADAEGSLTLDAGVLKLRSESTRLLGGSGRIEADLVLFEKGRLLDEPKLRAVVKLDGIDIAALVGEPARGRVDIDLEIGDESGRAAPLSRLRASGAARAPQLVYAGTSFKGARVWFRMTQDEVSIERLILPVHLPVSPGHAPSVTVPVGRITGDGTIGLGDVQPLDLLVRAEGVPIDVVARLLDVKAPVRGQIGRGTELRIGGRLARPLVDGTIALVGVSAGDIALGTGSLDVASDDVPAAGPLASHRALRVRGDMQTARRGPLAPLKWTLDAVVAIGEAKPNAPLPIEAELDVDFTRVDLSHLLQDPLAPAADTSVRGGFEDVAARVLTCDAASPMLSECVAGAPRSERQLAIRLGVERAWLAGGAKNTAVRADCEAPATLCSESALSASIEWPVVRLEQPWVLATGGQSPSRLEIDGAFDLSEPSSSAAAGECNETTERLAALLPTVTEGHRATARGQLDLASIEPMLRAVGLRRAEGRLAVDLALTGSVFAPQVRGELSSVSRTRPIVLELPSMPQPLQLSELDLSVRERQVVARGALSVLGQTLRFGAFDGAQTSFVFAGACEGRYSVAARGSLSGELVEQLAGTALEDASGAVDLERFRVAGTLGSAEPFEDLEGTLRFDPNVLRLTGVAGFSEVDIERGRIDILRCRRGTCGGSERDGWYGIFVGGRNAAGARARPSDALHARIDGRGDIDLWGQTFVSPDFESISGTRIYGVAVDVPYRHHDQRGRPVFDVELSSKDLALRGGAPLVFSGHVALDRARYVKDAIEGVDILRFADEAESIETPPPEIIANTQLDLRLETQRPLRVENNVASGVEANLVVDVTGTVQQPEFSGRLDVEPGGEVDLPFLTGTYEITRGRVTLLRDLADSEVDIVALRQEPVYIDDQPRRVQLLLRGPLSAIRPSCTTEGDTPNALDTVRGCTEYLVLGAGDVRVSESDVQRFGGGGLANARKPLQVVGHLTEFDIGQRAADALPRLRTYIPQMRLRLGQIGPELEIDTPARWFDFDYGRATLGWHYTRGYPGFLLRQSRDLTFRLQILEPISLEFRRQIRSYLNERIIFDPLEQRTIELKFDFQIPSLR